MAQVQQALIEVPIERIWELVGDVRRHPEYESLLTTR